MKESLVNWAMGGFFAVMLATPFVYEAANSRSEIVQTSTRPVRVYNWKPSSPRAVEICYGSIPSFDVISDDNRDGIADRKTHIIAFPRRGLIVTRPPITSEDQTLFSEALNHASTNIFIQGKGYNY
jgi:hypothetical protein